MTKLLADAVFDAALNLIKNNSVRAALCSAAPANYAGIAAVELGEVTISTADFTGPANGDTSGRKLTIDALTGIAITATGTATHLALHDNSAVLYAVTELTASQAVTNGNTASTTAADIEIQDPT